MQPDPRLTQALKVAGENKKELLKVLNYYRESDSLKYEAACFLIRNMPYYGSYEGEELYKYLRYFEGYSKTEKNAQEFVDSLKRADGEFVLAGNILVRQRGTKIHPGINVKKGSDDTLYSVVDGKVKFERKGKDKKQVSVYQEEA